MDITQPIIHDRHIVKQAMEQLIQSGPVQFEKPDDLTIVTCRNEGTLSDRVKEVSEEFLDNEPIQEIVQFLKSEKSRSICKPKNAN